MSGISKNDNAYWKLKELFSLKEHVECMLQFEAALARAEATVGVIPKEAAVVIAETCGEVAFDVAALEIEGDRAGTIVIPLVRELIARVEDESENASRYVHFGATSQDVLDTAIVLQIKQAIAQMVKDLLRIEAAFSALARKYAKTPMLGRTLMQAGPPISFGLKVAGWKAAITRGRARLVTAASSALTLQFGGAVGSLSSLDERGLEVARALAGELGLPLPDAPWHSHRDRLAELVSAIGILVGSLGKIARDLSLQMQPEVFELRECPEDGKGGSSAMPHKRNPIGCLHTLAAANRMPGMVSSFLSGMLQEHERGLGGWQAEWETTPSVFECSSQSISAMVEISEALEVFPKRMLGNLVSTREVVFSERLSMALVPKLGRTAAQGLVSELVEYANQSNRTLSEVAFGNSTLLSNLSVEVIEAVFSVEKALGSSEQLIDRLLEGKGV
jgi:3-carboxy-cis,cis-muconate cycloisomerase